MISSLRLNTCHIHLQSVQDQSVTALSRTMVSSDTMTCDTGRVLSDTFPKVVSMDTLHSCRRKSPIRPKSERDCPTLEEPSQGLLTTSARARIVCWRFTALTASCSNRALKRMLILPVSWLAETDTPEWKEASSYAVPNSDTVQATKYASLYMQSQPLITVSSPRSTHHKSHHHS